MKRLILVFFVVIVILSVSVACGTRTPGENIFSPTPKADGNYTVRIGFPSSAREKSKSRLLQPWLTRRLV